MEQKYKEVDILKYVKGGIESGSLNFSEAKKSHLWHFYKKMPARPYKI